MDGVKTSGRSAFANSFGCFGRTRNGSAPACESCAARTRTTSIWVEAAERPAAAFGHLRENHKGD